MKLDKETTRIILNNQIEIMRALAVLAGKPIKPCSASFNLLMGSASKTIEHMAKHYPRSPTTHGEST